MMTTIRPRKYEMILLSIIIISIFLPMPFSGKDIRFDIYPFLDYSSQSDYDGRKLSVIIYEIGSYLRTVIPLFILWARFRHIIFFTVFSISSIEFILYLLWFGQGTDPYLILFSGALIFVLFIRYKNGKKITV